MGHLLCEEGDIEPQPEGTCVTREEVRAWLEDRAREKRMREECAKQRELDIASGKIGVELLTGRELAVHHPEVFEGY